jgi:hypothetical protein
MCNMLYCNSETWWFIIKMLLEFDCYLCFELSCAIHISRLNLQSINGY